MKIVITIMDSSMGDHEGPRSKLLHNNKKFIKLRSLKTDF